MTYKILYVLWIIVAVSSFVRAFMLEPGTIESNVEFIKFISSIILCNQYRDRI